MIDLKDIFVVLAGGTFVLNMTPIVDYNDGISFLSR